MPIRITKFGGIIPKLGAEALPDHCAQLAHNCDVTGGTLKPIHFPGPFSQMHEGGSLICGVPTGDVVQIAKPAAPVESGRKYIAEVSEWPLQIVARDWVSWIEEGEYHCVLGRSATCTISQVVYTENGLEITAFLPAYTHVFNFGGPYALRGPRYQFVLPAAGATGGPEATTTIPAACTEADPIIPSLTVPLVDSWGNIYANFQVVDVAGMKYDEDYLVTDYDSYSVAVGGGYVRFRVNMNYAEPRRKHYYYVSTHMLGDKEGPPSEVSERIIVKPGEQVTLYVPLDGYTANRIYRSGAGMISYGLLDEETAESLVDTRKAPQNVAIPPYGNPPSSTTSFLEGAVMHPGGYAAAIYGSELWLSDLYRYWAWPEENIVPFTNQIQAIALSGNTILVFMPATRYGAGDVTLTGAGVTIGNSGGVSNGEVFGVSGGNPANTARYMISDTLPLLDKLTLCRIGDAIFWCSHGGIVMYSGGGARLITSDYFTRDTWNSFRPSSFVAKTADNSILLDAGDSDGISGLALLAPGAQDANVQGIRFDMGEGVNAVSTWSVLSGAQFQWRSKRFRFEKKTIIEYLRVASSAGVKATVYRDGVAMATPTLGSGTVLVELTGAEIPQDQMGATAPGSSGSGVWGDGPSAADAVGGHTFEVELTGGGEVYEVDLYERHVHAVMSDTLHLSKDQQPVWQSVWFRFPSEGKFRAIAVASPTTESISAILWADGANVWQGDVSAQGLTFFPRTLVDASLWRLQLLTDVDISEITLMAVKTEQAREGVTEINAGILPGWLNKRFTLPENCHFTSLKVAGAVSSINVYYNGSSTATSYSVSEMEEVPLNSYAMTVEFDFGGEDGAVRQVWLYASKAEPVPMGGLVIHRAPYWRHRLYRFNGPGRFRWVTVGAANYTAVGLILKADGVEVVNQPITSGILIPLDTVKGTLWEVTVITTADNVVDTVTLMPEEVVPVRDMIRETKSGGIPPWLHKLYVFENPSEITSGMITGETTVKSVRLEVDGTGSIVEVPSVGVEFPVRGLTGSMVQVSAVDGQDQDIEQITLYTARVESADNGVSIEDAPIRRRYAAFANANKFAAARILADDPCTVNFTVDDVAQTPPLVVESAVVTRLPREYVTGGLWELDVDTAECPSALFYPRRDVVVQGGAIRAMNAGGVPDWMVSRYLLDGKMRPVAVKVLASTYPVSLVFYTNDIVTWNGGGGNIAGIDGVEVPAESSAQTGNNIKIESGAETFIPFALGAPTTLEFGVTDDSGVPCDASVQAITVYFAQEINATRGFSVMNPDQLNGLRLGFDDRGRFKCGVVESSAYPVYVDLVADDGETYSTQVNDGHVFVFGRDLPKSAYYILKVSCEGTIYRMEFLPEVRRVVEGSIIRELGGNGIPAWMYTVYEVPGTMKPRSVRVDAYQNTQLRWWLDDEANEDGTGTTINSVKEVAVTKDSCRCLEFGFASSAARQDYLVREACVYLEETLTVEPWGIVIRGSGPHDPWCNKTLRFPETGCFTVARVVCDGACTMALDGQTETVSGSGAFKLTGTYTNKRDWPLELGHTGAVREVHLFAKAQVPFKDNIIARRGETPFTWLDRRFISTYPVAMSACRVVADGSVQLSIYRDGTAVFTGRTVSSDAPFRMPMTRPGREWIIEVTGPPGVEIYEVCLARSMEGLSHG